MSRIAASSTIAIASLALASCSQTEREPSVWDEAERGSSSEAPENNFGFSKAMEESSISVDLPVLESRAAPGISVTAAPGVAFTYRYAFVLGSDEIAGQQELHAQACEELGRAKCRITGMRYKLIDEDRIEAYLQFKLAPEVARDFGKRGIASIEDADGQLIEAVIVGTDAADQIQQLRDTSERLEQQIEGLEAQLRRGGQSAEERRQVERQILQLRSQIEAQEQTRETLAESLVNTPMTYFYRSDEGFSLGSNPIGDAGSTAWFSFSAMVAAVLTFLGIVLPWILLGFGLLALWRTGPIKRMRNWVRPKKQSETFADVT